MTKEVTKKATQDVTLSEELSGWGKDDIHLSTSDIIIPRILPMQGMSEMVTQRKAQFGEFRDSVDGGLLGTIDAPVAVIPFYAEKKWVEFERVMVGKEEELQYRSAVNITSENEGLPREEVIDGKHVIRDYVILVYVLVKEHIANGASFPYCISFKRTSSKAGRKLLTQMYVKNAMSNLPPAGHVINLLGRVEQNDKGTFIVLDTSTGERASAEEVKACLSWYTTMRQKPEAVKVDLNDDTDTPPPFEADLY